MAVTSVQHFCRLSGAGDQSFVRELLLGGPKPCKGVGLPKGGLAPASKEQNTDTEQKQEQTRQTGAGGPQPE